MEIYEERKFYRIIIFKKGSALRLMKKMEPERVIVGYNNEGGKTIVTTGIPSQLNYGEPVFTNLRTESDEKYLLRELARIRRRR